MDRASALLAALRAKAVLSGSRLDKNAVEALAGTVGLPVEELPMLVTQLQGNGQIALIYGGGLDVLPEPKSTGGVTFNFQGATFRDGATIAGRDATGGTIAATPESTLGALAAMIEALRQLRPELSGPAADAADEAAHAVEKLAAPHVPPEAKRTAALTAQTALTKLLDAAPKAKALFELGEKVLGSMT